MVLLEPNLYLGMISESSKRSTAKVPSHEIAWVMCITRPTSLQSKSIKKLSTVTVVFHSSILPDYFGHIECVWVFEYICSLNPVVQYCLSAYLPLFTCILTCIIPNVCPTRWVGYAHTHTWLISNETVGNISIQACRASIFAPLCNTNTRWIWAMDQQPLKIFAVPLALVP